MTNPVEKIDRIGEPGKGKAGKYKKENTTRNIPAESSDDSITISEEARDKSSGRRKKNILDYLKEIS